MTRLKHLLERNDSGVWGDEPDGESDAIVLRSTDIALDGSWVIDDPAVRCVREPERSEKLLAAGDLVVVKSSGSALHLGKTALVTHEVAGLRPCFANFVQRLRPASGSDPRYLWYLLNSSLASSHLERLGTTSTGLRNLNGESLGELPVPVVAGAEQRAIADLLDAETARIDALIENKRRMIALLDERLTSAIDRAFDSAASDVVPLKRLINPARPITYGIVQAGEHVLGGVPYIRPTDMNGHFGVPEPDRLLRTHPSIAEAYRRSTVRAGDVVISIGPSFGKTMIVPDVLDGANLTQGTARLAPAPGVSARYLVWSLRRTAAIGFWESIVGGATFRALNLEPLSRTPTPYLGGDDQRRVSASLDEQEDRSTSVQSALETQARLLAEHKRALVAAAVTGRRDVSKAAV